MQDEQTTDGGTPSTIDVVTFGNTPACRALALSGNPEARRKCAAFLGRWIRPLHIAAGSWTPYHNRKLTALFVRCVRDAALAELAQLELPTYEKSLTRNIFVTQARTWHKLALSGVS